MILALELCEEIVVYGMVSDSYCRSGRPGPGGNGRLGQGGPGAPVLAHPGGTLELWGTGGVGSPVGGWGSDTPWARCLVGRSPGS